MSKKQSTSIKFVNLNDRSLEIDTHNCQEQIIISQLVILVFADHATIVKEFKFIKMVTLYLIKIYEEKKEKNELLNHVGPVVG